MTKKKKILILVLAVGLVLALVIAPFGVSIYIYESVFGQRYETSEAYAWHMEDFPGLERQRYTFQSNQGQTLTGYRYYREGVGPRGLIVFAHGFGGGGHNTYMDLAGLPDGI